MGIQIRSSAFAPLPPFGEAGAAADTAAAFAGGTDGDVLLCWRPVADMAGRIVCHEVVPQMLVRGHHRVDPRHCRPGRPDPRASIAIDQRILSLALDRLEAEPAVTALIWLDAGSLRAGSPLLRQLAARRELASRVILGAGDGGDLLPRDFAALRATGAALAIAGFDGDPASLRQLMAGQPQLVSIRNDVLAGDRARLAAIAGQAEAMGAAVLLDFATAEGWRDRAVRDDGRWQATLVHGPLQDTPAALPNRDLPAKPAWRGLALMAAIAAPWMAIIGTGMMLAG